MINHRHTPIDLIHFHVLFVWPPRRSTQMPLLRVPLKVMRLLVLWRMSRTNCVRVLIAVVVHVVIAGPGTERGRGDTRWLLRRHMVLSTQHLVRLVEVRQGYGWEI